MVRQDLRRAWRRSRLAAVERTARAGGDASRRDDRSGSNADMPLPPRPDRKHRDQAVVLVSHADVIKSAVCHVLGLPVDSCFRFDIDPASITVVVAGDWGTKLLRLNEGV